MLFLNLFSSLFIYFCVIKSQYINLRLSTYFSFKARFIFSQHYSSTCFTLEWQNLWSQSYGFLSSLLLLFLSNTTVSKLNRIKLELSSLVPYYLANQTHTCSIKNNFNQVLLGGQFLPVCQYSHGNYPIQDSVGRVARMENPALSTQESG